MATKFQFQNKEVSEPGAYSGVEGRINSQPVDVPYGKVLVIDQGQGAKWGGGSGINGFLNKNKKSIQYYPNLKTMQEGIVGGLNYKVAENLFQPEGFDIPGASGVYYVRACTTTPGVIVLTLTNGSIEIYVANEGLIGNGSLDNISAKYNFTVASISTYSNVVSIKVNPGGGPITIGAYTTLNSDTIANVVNGIVNAINTATGTNGGYTATGNTTTGVITVLAPKSLGALANTYVPTISQTGTGNLVISGISSFLFGGVTGSNLISGYSSKMKVGNISGKFIFDFFVSGFKGLDENNLPWNNIEQVDSETQLLPCSSPQLTTIEEVVSWMKKSRQFQNYFVYKTHTIVGAGLLVSGDLVANTNHILASGGTETYNPSDMDKVLESIKELSYNNVLAGDFGDDARSTSNLKLLAHLATEAKYQKFMYVGGGLNDEEFDSIGGSLDIAIAYNNVRAIVVHSGYEELQRIGGYKVFNQYLTTASVLGRISGLAPQTPGTFKGIKLDRLVHELTESQRVIALDNGLLHLKYDEEFQKFTINQAINTLQDNDQLVNVDGKSYEIQINAIAAQLNKKLAINAKVQLLSQEDGVNRFTLSASDVKAWTKSFLRGEEGQLIIGSRNVQCETKGDSYWISYEFEPNYPINKLFFTGFMLDPNIQL